MRRIKRMGLITLPYLIVTGLLLTQTVSAANLSYDPYENEPKESLSVAHEEIRKQERLNAILDFPTLPLQGVAWGTEKVLNWVESTHFPKKVMWFWQDILHQNGLYPETRFSPGTLGVGAGGTIAFEELLGWDEAVPYFELHGKGGATIAGDTDVGAMYRFSQQGGLRLYHQGTFDFEHRENENFYGLGPRSSRGDGHSFEINTTSLEASLGLKPLSSIDIGGAFQYRHVTIHNGDVSGAGDITNFSIGDLPGMDGGKIVTLKSFLKHDTRDHPEDPSRGGLQQFGLSFNRDTAHDDNYFKYYLELGQYFQLWSERRVLALRFMGEHAQDFNHSSIPFFDLARLGGYGIQPIGSTTLRGYKYSRFFDKSSAVVNLEYRYNVWQYGHIGSDWIFFADLGKVFSDFHEFGIGKLRVSYGTGFRFKANRRVFLSIQLARSSEGTEIYVKTKTPF